MNQHIEYDLPIELGVGSLVGLLSFVASTDLAFCFNVQPHWSVIYDLKRILSIPDEKLTLNPVTDRPLDRSFVMGLNDNAKVFSPYIKPRTVDLFGKPFTTASRSKPYVGIVGAPSSRMFTDIYLGQPRNTKDQWIPKYPFSKIHIDKLTTLCLEAGYDVITINALGGMNLEDKIYAMNQLCDFIVSYEGGLAHVAHCSDIPVIMWPWETGPEQPMLLHLDKKTYFLNSADDILTWTTDTLDTIKRSLDNGQGNNRFLTGEYKSKIATWSTDQLFDAMQVPEILRDMTKQHVTDLNLGGYAN
jgi:hypothetical protein